MIQTLKNSLSSEVSRNLQATTLSKLLEFGILFVVNYLLVHSISVEEYGEYKTLLSLVGTTVVFIALGLPTTSKNFFADSHDPEDQRIKRKATFQLCLLLSVIGFILLLPVSTHYFNLSFETSIFAILVFPFFLRMFFESALIGSGALLKLSKHLAIKSLVLFAIIGILFSTKTLNSQTALLAQTGSFAFIILYYLKDFQVADGNTVKRERDTIVSNNLSFGKFVYFGSLFSVGSNQATVALMSIFADGEVAGLTALCLTLIMPLHFLCLSLADIQYKKLRNSKHVTGTNRFLTVSISSIVSAVHILSIPFILKVFPSQYYTSIYLSAVVSASMPLRAYGLLLNRSLLANESGKILFAGSVVTGIGYIFALIFGIQQFGVLGIALGITAWNLLTFLVHLIPFILKGYSRFWNLPSTNKASNPV